MNRIDTMFAALKLKGETALVPFITAGHPFKQGTPQIMQALADSGADLIELGVPFSDPMADGPVIQLASEKALAQDVSLADVLAYVSDFRKSGNNTPVILMGYLNPIERFGWPRFLTEAQIAGVDGVLLVDMPPEENAELRPELEKHGLHQIYLIAPTTRPERMQLICDHAGGFVYYVSLKGVTGASNLSAGAVDTALDEIRKHTGLPVGVGFGIKNAEDAVRVAEHADAVVIGSALVQTLDQANDTDDAVRLASDFLSPIRTAVNGVGSKVRKAG